jgi:N-acyl-D-amino-acid deacylase
MKFSLPSLLAVVIAVLFIPRGGLAEEIPVTGQAQPGLESFDAMMGTFLADHHVPGASLAVTRNGRLVYARGFGWADRDARQPVAPTSLFRLASISKPITAVAILKLVDAGRLALDDHPFAMLTFEPIQQVGFEPDPRLKTITVLQLLQHRGGFDRGVSIDPMFESVPFAKLAGHAPPATASDLIRVMEGRPLDFAPGERYAYSNFGYCVLGRLIEKVSGQPYRSFVQNNVLHPLKVQHMQLGRTLLADRAPGEVCYYTAKPNVGDSIFPENSGQVSAPYGFWCIESMDSHGGWISSAVDLIRFASALDDPAASGILEPDSVVTMFRRPPAPAAGGAEKPVWYGCGWSVRDVGNGRINTWHTGLLAGTSTLVVRRSDGLDWAVLFNQDRDADGKILADLIDPLVHKAADAVTQWPAGVGREQLWK